jgi:Flp pilus assembly protein TadG
MIGPIAKKQERGVTMVLMAFCLMALLAMAALAIDVVSLYVASTQAQRAADAAALAGARAFASSGYTSAPTGWTTADLCQNSGPGAAAAANKQAESVAAQNLISGQTAAVKTIACDFTNAGNPQLTVTIQRTGLPTFFARIWGASASSVTASSTAEAYNPSGSATPIQTSGVKPWLLPNCDPDPINAADPNPNCPGHSRFVSAADGSITNNGSFIGKTITLQYTGGNPPVQPLLVSPDITRYYRLDIPINPPNAVCPGTSAPSCGQVGSVDYLDNIACASANAVSCGQPIGAGQTISVLTGGGGLGNRTNQGTRCLIHASGAGLSQGQDIFTTAPGNPVTIAGGNNNTNPALQGITSISRSDSVVSVPLYDGSSLCPAGCNLTKTIVGFLQLAVTQNKSGAPNGQIKAIILNASGCNPAASGTAVAGGGISPVPVRLIHQ